MVSLYERGVTRGEESVAKGLADTLLALQRDRAGAPLLGELLLESLKEFEEDALRRGLNWGEIVKSMVDYLNPRYKLSLAEAEIGYRFMKEREGKNCPDFDESFDKFFEEAKKRSQNPKNIFKVWDAFVDPLSLLRAREVI